MRSLYTLQTIVHQYVLIYILNRSTNVLIHCMKIISFPGCLVIQDESFNEGSRDTHIIYSYIPCILCILKCIILYLSQMNKCLHNKYGIKQFTLIHMFNIKNLYIVYQIGKVVQSLLSYFIVIQHCTLLYLRLCSYMCSHYYIIYINNDILR